jgi:hypothetical protein
MTDKAQWCADLDRITERVWAPIPTCEGCRHFRPNAINPGAAVGDCARGLGTNYPMQRHHCRQREAIQE